MIHVKLVRKTSAWAFSGNASKAKSSMYYRESESIVAKSPELTDAIAAVHEHLFINRDGSVRMESTADLLSVEPDVLAKSPCSVRGGGRRAGSVCLYLSRLRHSNRGRRPSRTMRPV